MILTTLRKLLNLVRPRTLKQKQEEMDREAQRISREVADRRHEILQDIHAANLNLSLHRIRLDELRARGGVNGEVPRVDVATP